MARTIWISGGSCFRPVWTLHTWAIRDPNCLGSPKETLFQMALDLVNKSMIKPDGQLIWIPLKRLHSGPGRGRWGWARHQFLICRFAAPLLTAGLFANLAIGQSTIPVSPGQSFTYQMQLSTLCAYNTSVLGPTTWTFDHIVMTDTLGNVVPGALTATATPPVLVTPDLVGQAMNFNVQLSPNVPLNLFNYYATYFYFDVAGTFTVLPNGNFGCAQTPVQQAYLNGPILQIVPGTGSAVLDDGAGGITFQPAPSITSNKPAAAEPNQCNVQTLRVRCLDQNQSPVPSCNISLQLTPDPTDVGGHIQAYHTTSHPLGNIVVLSAGALPPNPSNCPAGSNSGQYSFTTPVGAGAADQGTALLLYYAPEASGSVVISGTASANAYSASIGPASIHVAVPNLQPLNAIADVLQLTGTTNPHPSNHYGQPDFIANLSLIATQYDATIRQPNALQYPFAANDESLVEGGLFDLDSAYDHAAGHALHRLGLSADVGSGLPVPFQVAVPPSVRTSFNKLVIKYGLRVVNEGNGCYPIPTPAVTCTHWHLQY